MLLKYVPNVTVPFFLFGQNFKKKAAELKTRMFGHFQEKEARIMFFLALAASHIFEIKMKWIFSLFMVNAVLDICINAQII